MGYSSIAWLPLCAGLTILGFVLSYVVGRRRGRLAMLRGVAWSLLPIAAYLTGSVEMFWKIGAAIGHYADGFVFSPVKWAGIAVAGLAALCFVASGGRERRRAARLARAEARRPGPGATGPGTAPAPVAGGTSKEMDIAGLLGQSSSAPAASPASAKPASRPVTKPQKSQQPPKPRKPAGDDEDLSDIEDILRKRGILPGGLTSKNTPIQGH